MRKHWAAGVLAIIVLLVPMGQAVPAAAAAGDEQVYETVLSGSGVGLSGVMTSEQLFFQIEDYWNVSEVVLRLDYQISQLADDEHSSVTLSLNGTTFHSFRPEREDRGKRRLELAVPPELANEGVNTLTIAGDVRTHKPDQACVYGEQRDNWFQLYDTSTAVVHYSLKPLDGSIGGFQRYFTGVDMSASGSRVLAVPEDNQPAELEAAVHVLSGLAKAGRSSAEPVPLVSLGDERVEDKRAAVVVSLYDHLPDALKRLVQLPGNVGLDDHAWIQTAAADGGTQMLIVTSNNPELLVKAGRLLANPDIVGQLSGRSKAVNAATHADTPEVPLSRSISLTEAGDRLTGYRHQERAYFLSFPANRMIADESRIDLDFRYSANLDFARSLVTVLLNDRPIGSKKLSEAMANGDTLSLPIPANAGVSGNFAITVAFDLELDYTGCIQVQEKMPWAFITPDSTVRLNMRDRTELLFNNYPSPFLRDGRLNDIAVVVPAERDRYTYLAISNVFYLLGQYADANTGNIHFHEDGAEADQLAGRHVIAFGSYRNNAVIRDHNGSLYFQYADDGSRFVSNEKMSIEESYGERIGTLQLIDSPYTPGYAMLAVTGAGTEAVYLASRLIESDGVRWQVYGDAAITDKDGNTAAFRFKREAERGGQSFVEEVLSRPDALGFAAAGVLTLVLVTVALLLLLRKHTRKRRNGNET